ncbi:MAG: [FeFe] hydrogenase H-cluster radical SAM maturase HydE [Desulfovibrionaceae bacterium]|nr:[FeFe] hydrogenase H-cluster radical SAM maturase HydE [Desulfovibrionaceae bacterium]
MRAPRLSDRDLLRLIAGGDPDENEDLFAQARKARQKHYGNGVYFRGLIEITNYCRNDCYYCGLRRSNAKLERYRLSLEEILACCRAGDRLGYKTFVLQGGDDPRLSDTRAVEIISAIRREFPGHALTLSFGERSRESYAAFFAAGGNRYLLRHESASEEHYARLHPPDMNPAKRKECLRNLKDIGFQTGAGFMVGSPFQTPENLLEDLRFLEELQPQMIGIGPFIPHKDTPFGEDGAGGLTLTLKMIALTRIMLPKALIPATTALGTIVRDGWEQGFMAGANVIMPNLTPASARRLYALYDNKVYAGDGAEALDYLAGRIRKAGLTPEMGRGDAPR